MLPTQKVRSPLLATLHHERLSLSRDGVSLVGFLHLITRMPDDSYHRWLRSLFLCPLFYMWRLSIAINCLSSVIFSSKPRVDKKIALHAWPAAMNYTWLISTVPVHSECFPSPLSTVPAVGVLWTQLLRPLCSNSRAIKCCLISVRSM